MFDCPHSNRTVPKFWGEIAFPGPFANGPALSRERNDAGRRLLRVSELQRRLERRSGRPRRAARVALAIACAALACSAYIGTIPSARAVTEVTAQSPVDLGPQATAPPIATGAQPQVPAASGSRDLLANGLLTLAFVAVGMGAVVLDRRRRLRRVI
jgi:hypothetical protein